MVGICHLTDSHHNHHGQKPTMVGICHGGNMPVGHFWLIMRNSKLPENRPRLGLGVGYLGDLRGSLSLEALTERLGAFVVSQNP